LQALGRLPSVPLTLDRAVRDAVVELDAWDEPNFAAIETTLVRQFPEQAAFVFEALAPTSGPAALLGVERLLDRLDALEQGTQRPPPSRDADQAAIQLLAKRGYTTEERTRLRDLVLLAKRVPTPPPGIEQTREQTLIELYRWLTEWATHARNAIDSRATLIRLGLAQRRKAAASEDPTPEPKPAA